MNAKIEEIITQLKDLSLIEATELVKQIEEVFDVDASATGGGVIMAGGPAAGSAEPTVLEFRSLNAAPCSDACMPKSGAPCTGRLAK